MDFAPNACSVYWLVLYIALVYGQFEFTKRLVPKSNMWTCLGILAPIAFMFLVRIVFPCRLLILFGQ